MNAGEKPGAPEKLSDINNTSNGTSFDSASASAVESENAAIAARSFRIVGTIVFLFQFLYLAADRATMAQYQHIFLPYYAINGVDAVFAVAVTFAQWFKRYWKPLALIQVGVLAATGTIMNSMSGTPTPQFYIIITFSFGCATFLPWGATWQSALNLVCLVSYLIVSLNAGVAEPFVRYQWISLLAVLILSEFPAAFIDQYRRRVFRQLEALAQSLKASRDKSEFLASMSHEMRTLLNTIVGMTEVLEGTAPTPEQLEYLRICHASGDALVGLINDIVDISRIEAGELQLDRVEFDLEELLGRVVDALALRAHRKDLELILHITQGTPVKLIGDPMRLQQVCLNLLVNAIKFTEQGQIVMRVEKDTDSPGAGALRFCVADTGIGISSEGRQRIFSRFAQVTSSTSSARAGSGLGLEISKRLVEAMGGKIWVESVPGMGSTFCFTSIIDLQTAATDDLANGARLAGTRVLVIDDNATTRVVIREMLERAGSSVSLCESAMDARRQLTGEGRGEPAYDAILLDRQMPPDDGIELAKEFDSSDRERTIVMLTRDDYPSGPRAAREAGVKGYLLKPIKRSELIDAVASVAARGPAAEMSATEPAPQPRQNSRALQILLAEDSEDNRLLMAAFLRNTPYKLDSAENGRVAVEMFKARRYDLVLVDVNMPVLSGYEAVAAMRAWELEHGIGTTPIVALTGRAMVEDRARSLKAGCNGHLTKPLRRDVLIEAISHFTSGAPAQPT